MLFGLIMAVVISLVPVTASATGESGVSADDGAVPLLAESPPVYPMGEARSEPSENSEGVHTPLCEESLPIDSESSGKSGATAGGSSDSAESVDENKSETHKSAYEKIHNLTY